MQLGRDDIPDGLMVGCVWCGTSSTPWAWASAAQRCSPVTPPILNPHPGIDQVGQRRKRVGLLAGGDGDVELARQLAQFLTW